MACCVGAITDAYAICPRAVAVPQIAYDVYRGTRSDVHSYIQRRAPEYGLIDRSSVLRVERGEVAIAELCSGAFVAVWLPEKSGRVPAYLAARLFKDNQFVTDAFRITSSNEQQWQHSVAPLHNGGFLVTWKTWQSVPGTRKPIKIRGRLFDSTGKPVGRELNISSSEGSHGAAKAYGLPNGGFVVLWHTWELGAQLRIFDAKGAASTDQILIAKDRDIGLSLMPYGHVTKDGMINVFISYSRIDLPEAAPFALARSYDALGTAISPLLEPPEIEPLPGYNALSELLVLEVASSLELLLRHAREKDIVFSSLCRREDWGSFVHANKWKSISREPRMKRFFQKACEQRLKTCPPDQPELKRGTALIEQCAQPN